MKNVNFEISNTWGKRNVMTMLLYWLKILNQHCKGKENSVDIILHSKESSLLNAKHVILTPTKLSETFSHWNCLKFIIVIDLQCRCGSKFHMRIVSTDCSKTRATVKTSQIILRYLPMYKSTFYSLKSIQKIALDLYMDQHWDQKTVQDKFFM